MCLSNGCKAMLSAEMPTKGKWSIDKSTATRNEGIDMVEEVDKEVRGILDLKF